MIYSNRRKQTPYQPVQKSFCCRKRGDESQTSTVLKGKSETPHVVSYNSEIQTSVPLGSRSNNGIISASARWMQPQDAGRPRLV